MTRPTFATVAAALRAINCRLSRARRHIRRGRRYGYPPCCVARFAWDTLRDRPSGGLLRAACTLPRADGEMWVPCGLFHHADPVQVQIAAVERARRAATHPEEAVRRCRAFEQ